MSGPEIPIPRTAAATKARQQRRALRLAGELASVVDLLDPVALAAMYIVVTDEIRHRKAPDRVTTSLAPHLADCAGAAGRSVE